MRRIASICGLAVIVAAMACSQRPLEVEPYVPPGSWEVIEFPEVWFGGVGGSSPSNIYISTENQMLLHFDGTAWNETPGPPDTVCDLFVFDDGILANGQRTLYRFENGTWQTVSGLPVGRVLNLFALGTRDFYCSQEAYRRSLIIHVTNDTATIDTLQERNTTDIWASTNGDVYTIGRWSGTLRTRNNVLRRVGGVWEDLVLPTQREAQGVSGFDETEVYVHDGEEVYLFDGASFSELSFPDLKPTFGYFRISDIAVDEAGMLWVCTRGGGILSYDGGTWTLHPRVTGYDLARIWVGGGSIVGKGEGKYVHRHNGQWNKYGPGRVYPSESGIVGFADNDMYLLGYSTTAKWDGESLVELPPVVIGWPTDLWRSPAGVLRGVGPGGDIRALVDGWWVKEEASPSVDLSAIDGISENEVYAVGERGVVLRYDGDRWFSIFESGEELIDVRNVERESLVTITSAGTIRMYRGGIWTTEVVPGELTAIWASSWNDIFVVGEKIYRFDGVSWREQYRPPHKPRCDSSCQLLAIGGTSNNLWAVGTNEELVHYDGAVWTQVPNEVYAFDAWVSPTGSIYTWRYNELLRFR